MGVQTGGSAATVVEPAPEKSDRTYIADAVIGDLRAGGFSKLADAIDERKQFGIRKYGTALQAFNGRRPIVDAYQEVLDGILYLRQAYDEAVESHEFLKADAIFTEYLTLIDVANTLQEM